MLEGTGAEPSEHAMSRVDVQQTGDGLYEVDCPHIDLKYGESIPLWATIQKLPLELQEGQFTHGVHMDITSPSLDEITSNAGQLAKLPENQRPRALLRLLRSQVDYPYQWKLEELEQSGSPKVDWYHKELKKGNATLSGCVSNGLAECDQLAVLLLHLGTVAGLKGTISTYYPTALENNIVNVARSDTGEQLFKSIALDQTLTVGHAWAEFLMPNGTWLPADPATQLVGDSEEGLETFRRANYHAPSDSIEVYDQGLPQELYLNMNRLAMKRGEAEKTGLLRISPRLYSWGGSDTPTQYSGALHFSITSGRTDIPHNYLPVRLTSLQSL